MDSFRIFETTSFIRDLRRDFSGQQDRIRAKLTNHTYPQLRLNSFFGNNIKKLRSYDPPTWRYRIGDYRFFYTIDDKRKLVVMLAADNRQSAY